MKSLQPPLRIDFSPLKLLRAPSEAPLGPALAGRSVRSLWDLFLSATHREGRDEIVVSDMNIPTMFGIAEAHGYKLRSAPLDPATGLPSAETIGSVLGPRSAAVLVAQLFGNWSPLNGIRALCDRHGAYLVEDCAQSYLGRDFGGSTDAHLSLYSFGLIKRSSVGFGALALLRDEGIASAMGELSRAQAPWPIVQSLSRFAKTGLMDAVSSPPLFPLLMGAARRFSRNPDALFTSALRGFPPGPSLAPYRVRLSPCAESFVRRAWNRDAHTSYLARARLIDDTLADFPLTRERLVGQAARIRSYWLLPLRVPQPSELIERLRRAGHWAVGEVTSLEARRHPEALGPLCYLPIGARARADHLRGVLETAESFLP